MHAFFTASSLRTAGILPVMPNIKDDTDPNLRNAAAPLAHQRFSAYRAMLASPSDEMVHWWYFGTVTVMVDGLPAIPALNAATLMIYRTETLSPDRFAIHWDEVGYFADYVTGEPITSWLNPVTGERVRAAPSFAEGPARYEVTRAYDGVAVTLSQPGATVRSIAVEWRSAPNRVWIVQREHKMRGFPEVDGRIPDPQSASGFEAVTALAFVGDWPATGSNVQGLYEFALAGAPPWMGLAPGLKARATVNGVIMKAAVDAPPRPDSSVILRKMFPGFFAKHGL
jgi:hypothetical protein